MEEKHFTECFIVISNYLWDGNTESQGHAIHYIPHELAYRMQIPVILVNIVPYPMLRKWPKSAVTYRPGIHTRSDVPLTIVNFWSPDWRLMTGLGKSVPLERAKKRILKAMKQVFAEHSVERPFFLFAEPTHLNLVKAVTQQFDELRKSRKSSKSRKTGKKGKTEGAERSGGETANQKSPVVWFSTDDYASGDPEHEDIIRRSIKQIGNFADAVCTVSPTLKAAYQDMSPTLLLKNAADRGLFQQIKEDIIRTDRDPLALQGESIPKPRIVFVGMMNQRIDYPALRRAVREHQQYSFVFIGKDAMSPNSDDYEIYMDIRKSENTYFLGLKNRFEIAEIFAVCSIGIIPYKKSSFNMASSPLKLYEYAAADLPVISTALPALEHSRGSAYLMDDENLPDFSEVIDQVFAQYDDYRLRITSFSKENTWENRIEKLQQFVLDLQKRHTD